MAREITFTKSSINVELLDQELREEFGTLTTGLSRRGETVTVYMTQDITATQLTAIRNIIESHDSSQKTLQQHTQAGRQTEIRQSRIDFTTPLDPTLFTGLLGDLAERVRWLEQEIRDLRNL